MARPESIAVGGYYKTPEAVVHDIARLFAPVAARQDTFTFVDPCAGDGEALALLGHLVIGDLAEEVDRPSRRPRFSAFCCELEAGRYEGRAAISWKDYCGVLDSFLHGDAFLVEWTESKADVLYLNPPYDTDRIAGRLEQRFLERFTSILRPGHGLLLFVVPHYALETSAVYLATHYDELACYRFPPGEYEAYRQVVLVGRRRASLRPFAADSPEAEQVRRWAAEPEGIPSLAAGAGTLRLPERGGHSLSWKMGEIDVLGLYETARPLMEGKTGSLIPVHGLGLNADLTDLITQRFPVVVSPRPAHVAIALAAGLVNGHAITPDDPAAGWPDLMVKGVFRKEYKVIEEKVNKEGEVTSQTAVQQPKLSVSILDMRTWTYHDLAEGGEPSGATSVADFNIADLLTHYGHSLATLMREQCPPLYEPDGAPDLPPLGLPLYPYQQHAAAAALRVITADRPPFAGEHPFILGEVGTGKTAVALAVAAALRPGWIERLPGRRPRPVRRMLVMCPPHLVASWAVEAGKFLPDARVETLERLADVERIAAEPPDDRLTILLLSREMSKLGHGWADGRHHGLCPGCGTPVAGTPEEIVRQRVTCDHRPRRAANAVARQAERLARALARAVPDDNTVVHLLAGRYERQRATWLVRRWGQMPAAEADAARDTAWSSQAGVIREMAEAVFVELTGYLETGEWAKAEKTADRLRVVLHAAVWPRRDERIVDMALAVAAATGARPVRYGQEDALNSAATLLMQTTLGRDAQLKALDLMRELDKRLEYARHAQQIEGLAASRDGREWQPVGNHYYYPHTYLWVNGRLCYRHGYQEQGILPIGGTALALRLLEALLEGGRWREGTPCGTPLYAAVPSPRRFPLATYIARRHPDLFDLLVLDEAHEYSTDGSAQERAAHRLTEVGRPTLLLTGTSNNGYASSLFMNMWALSRRFRSEFGRDQQEQFVNRYGYRKVRIDPDEDDLTTYNNYGAMSDRVDTGTSTKMRKIGQAPGVLPLFILRHMLPSAVLLQKSDMEIELPPMTEIAVPVTAGETLLTRYHGLREALVAQIMDDLRQQSDLAGLLWGQMGQMPTYLDRAHTDTGNTGPADARRYEIRYPASVGATLVAAADPLPKSETAAKEAWLLETLAAEMAEGRHCIVFVVNTNSGLAQRVTSLIGARFGRNTAVMLNARSVRAGDRMDWIDKEVVGRGRRVLVVNPEAVETGLNNLVYFSTAIWFQNPNCSSVTYTQANGRVHRPGQRSGEVRVYVPYYGATTQEAQFILLGHKIAAARQADGLDVTSALLAAGAAESDGAHAMSVGQALYRMLREGQIAANGHGFAQGRPSPMPVAARPPTPAARPMPTKPARQMSLFGGNTIDI